MKKHKVVYIVLILLIIGISLGFALLSSNLNINGSSRINKVTWDVHIENVQVTTGSVTAPTPTVDTSRTAITYNVTLEKPGDFYEFTFDIVNDGSIDAKIDDINTEFGILRLPSYLRYHITFSDDTPLLEYTELNAGERYTCKVRVYFISNVLGNELPTQEKELSITTALNFTQKTGYYHTKPEFIYSLSTSEDSNIDINNGNYYYSVEDLKAAKHVDKYIRQVYVTANSGNIEMFNNSIGFELDGKTYYLPGGSLGSYVSEADGILFEAFGSDYCIEYQEEYAAYYECQKDGLTAQSFSFGTVMVKDSNSECLVNYDPGSLDECS